MPFVIMFGELGDLLGHPGRRQYCRNSLMLVGMLVGYSPRSVREHRMLGQTRLVASLPCVTSFWILLRMWHHTRSTHSTQTLRSPPDRGTALYCIQWSHSTQGITRHQALLPARRLGSSSFDLHRKSGCIRNSRPTAPPHKPAVCTARCCILPPPQGRHTQPLQILLVTTRRGNAVSCRRHSFRRMCPTLPKDRPDSRRVGNLVCCSCETPPDSRTLHRRLRPAHPRIEFELLSRHHRSWCTLCTNPTGSLGNPPFARSCPARPLRDCTPSLVRFCTLTSNHLRSYRLRRRMSPHRRGVRLHMWVCTRWILSRLWCHQDILLHLVRRVEEGRRLAE